LPDPRPAAQRRLGLLDRFRSEQRSRYDYRVDPLEEGKSRRNVSTLDDDTTQAALRFLMRLDRALDVTDERVHEAALYGLNRLLEAQYPNGAWPQRFQQPPDPAKFLVKKASYPDQWSRKYSGTSYSSHYTFNDNTIGDTIDVMFLAWHTYGDNRYRSAAERGGQFILLAQMPDPQPAWHSSMTPTCIRPGPVSSSPRPLPAASHRA